MFSIIQTRCDNSRKQPMPGFQTQSRTMNYDPLCCMDEQCWVGQSCIKLRAIMGLISVGSYCHWHFPPSVAGWINLIIGKGTFRFREEFQIGVLKDNGFLQDMQQNMFPKSKTEVAFFMDVCHSNLFLIQLQSGRRRRWQCGKGKCDIVNFMVTVCGPWYNTGPGMSWFADATC